MTTRLQSQISTLICFSAGASEEVVGVEMTGIAAYDVMGPVTAATSPAPVPDWIKLAPRGAFTARDGRQLSANPETLVARFTADTVDIPVDINHATVRKAATGDAAPAIGWISELQARPDGLYGRVAWLEEGLRVLKGRTHRYVSPTLKVDNAGNATWLHSVALVSAPGVSMPALAAADLNNDKETKMSKTIALALGLADDAGETACLNAIRDLSDQVDTRVEKSVHDKTLEMLDATKGELEDLQAAIRKDKVDALLDGALKAKKIAPAERAEYEALCANDAGLATVTKLLAAKSPALGASGLDKLKTPTDAAAGAQDHSDIDPVTLGATVRNRVAEAAARGILMDFDAAFDAALTEMRA